MPAQILDTRPELDLIRNRALQPRAPKYDISVNDIYNAEYDEACFTKVEVFVRQYSVKNPLRSANVRYAVLRQAILCRELQPRKIFSWILQDKSMATIYANSIQGGDRLLWIAREKNFFLIMYTLLSVGANPLLKHPIKGLSDIQHCLRQNQPRPQQLAMLLVMQPLYKLQGILNIIEADLYAKRIPIERISDTINPALEIVKPYLMRQKLQQHLLAFVAAEKKNRNAAKQPKAQRFLWRDGDRCVLNRVADFLFLRQAPERLVAAFEIDLQAHHARVKELQKTIPRCKT